MIPWGPITWGLCLFVTGALQGFTYEEHPWLAQFLMLPLFLSLIMFIYEVCTWRDDVDDGDDPWE